MLCRLFLALIVPTIAFVSATATADVVNIPAAKDNTLYENASGALSNGAGEHFFAGRTDQSSDYLRRGLIAFDVNSAIPTGSVVNSVTLTLNMSRTRGGNEVMSLHRVIVDWGEAGSVAAGQEGGGGAAVAGDATWLHTFSPGSFWASPGGDYAPIASATQSVDGNGFYSWSSAGMVSDVQGWLAGSPPDFGWIIIGNESTEKNAKRFDSRENGTPENRPVLTVDFTPIGTTGACCFGNGNCTVVATATDCTNAGGIYEGDGTTCVPNPCPQPVGACCLPGGACNVETAADCTTAGGIFQGEGTTCTPNPCPIFLEPFVDALPIPALATPTSGTQGGVATYDIAIRETEQQLHRDLALTTVWGYDDGSSAEPSPTYPGPTILASAGNAVTVNWSNDLRYSSGASEGQLRQEHYLPVDLCPHGPDHEGDTARTVVHLHGGHVPSKYDGYPEETQLPGESVQYIYPNNQLGATLWYHDHALGITRLNVIMGLAGFYLLRDATEQNLIDTNQLPSGEFEIGMAIQDRTFDVNGEFVYPATWQDMWYGDKILVNGKVWPFLDVKRGKYRFHLLNGSTTRSYTLSLSGGATFTVISNDGGLLDAPVGPLSSVHFGPGERIGVIIDFQPFSNNTDIFMTNSAPVPPGEPVVTDVIKFHVQGGGGFTNALPATLRTNEVLMEGDAVKSRDFLLQKDTTGGPPCSNNTWWLINGLTWEDITEYPELDTIEIWRFQNPSGMMHPMHMHLVFFQVLDRKPLGGGASIPLEPWEAGWKDTVRVQPGTEVRVIARFESFEGLYAYHCHILEHEDHEMMRQFQAVKNCPADSDRNGVVDVNDLLSLLAIWGDCPEPCSDLGEPQEPVDTCPQDSNRDCEVDVADLLELLAKWGPCA